MKANSSSAAKRFESVLTSLRLLNRTERARAIRVLIVLVVGVALEIVSFTALIPAVSVISERISEQDFPLLGGLLVGRSESVVVLVVVVVLSSLFAVKSLYSIWSIWYQREFCRIVEERLTIDAIRFYLQQPFLFHVDNSSSMLLRNMGIPGQFVSLSLDSILTIGTDGAVFFALIGVLLIVEPIATTVVLGLLAFLGMTFHLLTKRRIQRWGKQRLDLEADRIRVTQEGFAAIKELKALECEEEFATRFEGYLFQSTRIGRNFTVLASIPRVWLEFLAFIGLGALMIALTSGGRTIVDALPELSLFAASAFRLLPAVNRIIFALQNIQFGLPAFEALSEIKPLAKAEIESSQFSDYYGDIELRNVSFKYPKSPSSTLKEISLIIPHGQVIGISGESGSGKSTLVCLLLGLLPATSGEILIGGNYVSGTMGRNIGYVPQSVYLVDDSIARNVAFGLRHEEISESRVWEVLHQARLSEFVTSLEGNIHYVVGENGSRLSGGQRQRIGIARALYADPDIVILDEATSALDIGTASELLREVSSLRGSKTVVLVSHDEKVLEACDSVFELSKGTIANIQQ